MLHGIQIEANAESVTKVYSSVLLQNFGADPCGENYRENLMEAARATHKVVNAYAITVSPNEVQVKKQLTANSSKLLYSWNVVKNGANIQITAYDPDNGLSITLDGIDELINSLIEKGSMPLAAYVRYILIENEYLSGEGTYTKSSKCESADYQIDILVNSKRPTQLLTLFKSKETGYEDIVSIGSNIELLSKTMDVSYKLLNNLEEGAATEEQRERVSNLKETFNKMFKRAEESQDRTKHIGQFMILRRVENNAE